MTPVKQEQEKTNLAIDGLRSSVTRLADELVAIHDHGNRIKTIEKVVF